MKDDTISRQAAIAIASGYCHHANIAKELEKLPSIKPPHPDREKIDMYLNTLHSMMPGSMNFSAVVQPDGSLWEISKMDCLAGIWKEIFGDEEIPEWMKDDND